VIARGPNRLKNQNHRGVWAELADRVTGGLAVATGIFLLCIGNGCDALSPIEKVSDGSSRDAGPSNRTQDKSQHGHLSDGNLGSMRRPGPDRLGESRFLRAPKLESLEVPDYKGANSIWGATGRDSKGMIYFGVAAYGVDNPSAALWRLDPSSDTFETLGLVNEQLDRLKIRRRIDWPETQMKIHSKIYQAADGRIYFSSQDEHDEAYDGSRNALYGGRIFALEPKTNTWECIHTTPEGLIALSARGRYVVAQGYFGHVLYQYDTQTKQMRSKKLGTYKGHASRNIFMDARGHVYGIRARIADSSEFEGVYELDADRVRVSLVELDTLLQEVNDWPLGDYAPTGNTDSHGITGFCEFNDGTIVFVTHSGALWQVRQQGGKSQLDRLGWMHPQGSSYCASLFAPYGNKFVCGFVNRKEGAYEWSVFDLQNKCSAVLPLDRQSAELLQHPKLLIYGCDTLDDTNRAYVVGWKLRGKKYVPNAVRMSPHVIRLSWE
jgi:hypothetical protein